MISEKEGALWAAPLPRKMTKEKDNGLEHELFDLNKMSVTK